MRGDFIDAFKIFDERKNKHLNSSLNKDNKFEFYWNNSKNSDLGAQYKSQIAFLIACNQSGMKPIEFYDRIVAMHNEVGPNLVPKRRGGFGRKKNGVMIMNYDRYTYEKWLKPRGQISPSGADLKNCLNLILKTADDILKPHLKPEASIREHLENFCGTDREAFRSSLSLLKAFGESRDWRAIPSRIFGVMPTGLRRGMASATSQERYEEVRKAIGAHRSVEVTGPHYSGKNTLLRKIVSEHIEGIQINNGSYLTICALSLYEMSGTEAINCIANFYRDALGLAPPGEGIGGLMAEIAHLARQFPALIVIAGLEAVDSDEIVRALHQDVLGEMVTHILAGHPDTRLLVSDTSRSYLDHQHLAPGGVGRRIRFDRVVDLADPNIPIDNYEYHTVRECASSLFAGTGRPPRRSLMLRARTLWRADDVDPRRPVPPGSASGLGKLISNFLLDQKERFCLGLVALCHDGLMPATIVAIIDALRDSLDPGLLPLDAIAVLDALPSEVVRKPTRRPGIGPNCYKIEQAIRTPLLEDWRDSAPGEFRSGCWGIARAAAAEARRLRVRSGLEVSAGRDVQVLILLLGSVEPDSADAVPPRRNPLERQVLPPLDDGQARMPDAATIVEFCFSTLFEGDLVRAAERGIPVLDDARLRLAAVYPFLNNRQPWLSHIDGRDPDCWVPADDWSPWLHLSRAAQLRLLAFATAAAARLNLHAVITTCTRLAEAIAQGAPLSPAEFLSLARIQRYELELGILLGRNPDAQYGADALMVPEFDAVEKRAAVLIAGVPAHLREEPAGKLELRKLHARHAEILRLRGKHVEALRKFRMTSRLHAEDGSSNRETGTLSGRSRRAYTQLLVELARARLFTVESAPSIVYGDGLTLPLCKRDDPAPRLLLVAERVLDESLRLLSHGSVNDRIGVKIDQARLSAIRFRYTEALDLLDQARNLVLAPGVSRDVLLEYLSVQGRTFADAMAFTAVMCATPRGVLADDEQELRDLAAYLTLDLSGADSHDWQMASAVSEALAARAMQSLDTLKRLVVLPDTVETRYAIFADHLEVWIAIVRSRERVASDDPTTVAQEVRAQLVTAAAKLEHVLETMVRAGYLLKADEAEVLIQSLVSFGVPVSTPSGWPSSRRTASGDVHRSAEEVQLSRSV